MSIINANGVYVVEHSNQTTFSCRNNTNHTINLDDFVENGTSLSHAALQAVLDAVRRPQPDSLLKEVWINPPVGETNLQ